MDLLYTRLYGPHEEFREAKKMVDERIMTRFDRARMEGRVEGEARGRVEGEARGRAEGMAEGEARGRAEGVAKVARNLLEAGVAKDIIVRATGLTMADIEKQAGMAASPSTAAAT
jgi:predicted transposase YdaD